MKKPVDPDKSTLQKRNHKILNDENREFRKIVVKIGEIKKFLKFINCWNEINIALYSVMQSDRSSFMKRTLFQTLQLKNHDL